MTGEHYDAVELDVRANAYISEKYIESYAGRLDTYKQIAEIQTVADYKRVYASLQDTYGALPRAVENLMVIAVLKSYAMKFHVKKVTVASGLGSLEFGSLDFLGDQRIQAALDKYAGEKRQRCSGNDGANDEIFKICANFRKFVIKNVCTLSQNRL